MFLKTKTTPNKNAARAAGANEQLLWAACRQQPELLAHYGNSLDGYNEETADDRRERFGENTITQQKGPSLAKRLVKAFISPFTVVLIVLAVISLITEVILAAPGSEDPVAVIIVTAMVLISGILQFVQESRSGKAAERLSEMVETTIAVQRSDRGVRELPIDEIVSGDIIRLTAGDMVPADLRILQAKDLFVGQSSLTGESEPVEKFGHALTQEAVSPLACENLAFMGSNVISGSALAVVINVGDDTIFGSLALQLGEKKNETSFDKGIKSVSWVLIRFMLVMVPLVLFLNGFTNGDWMQAFLFALSVAVGLTPEMLPTIVSANLAKGAVTLSKQKVIVKELSSIQNFGAIDVLCTDKTGTLTQDKVVMLHSLDIHGNEDKRVLRHAFLNSYYQTGLRNLMDVAILEYAGEDGALDWQRFEKADEIPFDFSRRRMSVAVQSGDGKIQLITKGAVEEMLAVCAFAEYGGQVQPLSDTLRGEILQKVAGYNDSGLRVLCIAQKTGPAGSGAFAVEDESDMVLMGFLAFLDPPKQSTAAAIAALREYGVGVKILTGDNDVVTASICRQVGLDVHNLVLGADIEPLSDADLDDMVEETTVFAKLSPQQKVRVIAALRRCGHVVGFMGDGINDAAAMKEADVGISVDTAVDIAKESADVILLEKDLMVLEQGVIEGRRTYANIIKYIKMTASSNFGNMFSVLAASAFLPFLPMEPMHILVLNLIYDICCIAIPWDNVDADFLRKPRRWDASSISKFMVWLGPTSSVFDITTYLLMYFYICPLVFGGPFHTLSGAAQAGFIGLFHAGWFVESMWSQTLVIHLIRTPGLPFVHSRASWQLTALTSAGIAACTLLPYTRLGELMDMVPMPGIYFPCLLATIILYMALVTLAKRVFIRRHGELL